jgi:photosystem II stability/assembly factor-like uncharacterized protein
MGHTVGTRSRRWIRAAGLGLGVFLGAAAATANGRYPYAQQLLVDPGDPNRLWLRATYGLLTSPDGGQSWDWICEAAIGYSTQEDPMLAITADGKVLVASVEGVLVSPDHGCSWSASPGIGARYVRDLAVEGDGKHVLALTTVTEQNGNYDLVVYRSDEAAESFSALSQVSADLIGLTLDPAPSDSKRIYVTGTVWPYAAAAARDDAGTSRPDASLSTANSPGLLVRSRDGGMTWDRRVITGASLDKPPFIAAVHPTNPDILYVRIQGAPAAPGHTVESTLVYTEDAGETWRELFRGSADMLGFSLSADGKDVRIGLGSVQNPADMSSGRQVDETALGIYRASVSDFSFTPLLRGQVGCLTGNGSALYVCGSHENDHFELAKSDDDGKTVSPLYDLAGARGVLACPRTTSTALMCTDQWQYICGQVGKCPTATTPDGGGKGGSATASSGTSGGCGCSTPGSAKNTKNQPSTVGTVRQSLLPESFESFMVASAVAAWFARRRKRT